MILERKIAIIIVAIVVLLAWGTLDHRRLRQNIVVQYLGGPDAQFCSLGENMAIKDIAIETSWMPFGK